MAALLYAGLALFTLYLAWTSPAHGVVGDWTHPDHVGNHWLYQWTAERLAGGQSILHNDRYYWPVGDAPFLAGNGSDAVPFTLLSTLVDWPFSVTLWCLLTLILNGLAGRAVASTAGVRPDAATLVGAFVVVFPYAGRELSAGRFAQAGLWTSGFFLARWLRHLERPTWTSGAVAALWFCWCAFQYWYYGLWMAGVGAALWCFQARRDTLARFVPLALLGTVPPLWLFLSNWKAIPGVEESTFPHPISVDYGLFAGFPLWSGWGELSSVALPATLSGLAALGWHDTPRPLRRGLLASAAAFYALSLGPEVLGPSGESTGLAAPFALVYRWSSTLQRFWWPYRHVAPLTLVLLPLAARGAERAIRWLDLRYGWLLLLALLPVELYARGAVVEVASSYWTAPAAYAKLAQLPPGNVLELPIYEKIARDETSLSYQRVHQNTLVNGHAMWVDRVRPRAWDEWIASQPLLAALRAFEAGDTDGPLVLADAAAPWDDGAVAYVTLNREYYPGELDDLMEFEAAFLTAWFGKPVIRSGGVRVWDVRTPPLSRQYAWPEWTAPAGYVSSSGLAAVPDTVRSAGWLNWPRNFPPSPPEARDSSVEETVRNARLPPGIRRKLEREAERDDTGGDVGEDVNR